MKKTFIHQPDFLPWIGFFEKLKLSNLFIILDDVQFLRRGWHHRDKIKIRDNWMWLTVPIKKNKFEAMIKDIKIDYSYNWIDKHLKTLSFYYNKADFFNVHFSEISKIYNKKKKFLIDLNTDFIFYITKIFKLKFDYILSSSLNVETSGKNRIIELLKKTDSKLYITGKPSLDYLDINVFKKEEIDIYIHEYKMKNYKQLNGKFIDKLSVIDFIMNSNENI